MKTAFPKLDPPPSNQVRHAMLWGFRLKRPLMACVLLCAMACGTSAASAALTNGNLDLTSISSQSAATPTGWTVEAARPTFGPFTDGAASEGFANVQAAGGKGLFFKPFQGTLDDRITVHFYQDNPGLPGTNYVLTGYAGAEVNYSGLIPEGGTGSEFALEFLDANNALITGVNLDLVADGLAAGVNFGYAQHTVRATAPVGTVTVRARASMLDAYNNPLGGGQAFVVDAFELNIAGNEPPTITNLSPDGTTLFHAPASGLSFKANSTTTNISANGIQLILDGFDVSPSLTISGPGGSRNVSYAGLKANQLYTALIRVIDDAGNAKSTTLDFDTFAADSFTWEAEDYDFDGSAHFNNPTATSSLATNSYFERPGTAEIDYHESGPWCGNDMQAYREASGIGPGLEWARDFVRKKHADAIALDPNVHDYDVGWVSGLDGDWMNYTRALAPGSYNLYGRLAGGGGVNKCQLSMVTSGVGTETQTTNVLGVMTMIGTGYQSWKWVPLTDEGGTLVQLTQATAGNVTFRASADGLNMNFFMLVPARTDLPVISNVYPTGSRPFEPGNTLSFTVSSTVATIPAANIQVTLNGNNVSPLLTIGSNPSSRTVSLAALAANSTYTATIAVTDSAGTSVSRSLAFDTFTESNYSFEAEDYNFNNGQYIASPLLSSIPGPTNYYRQGQLAVEGVDISGTPPVVGYGSVYGRLDPVGTEVTGDYLRSAYVTVGTTDPDVLDYNVGWDTQGTWFNYTRPFPAGNYWIYARLAGPGVFNATMDTVTGATSIDQTVTPLGTFNGSSTGYQAWVWVPLIAPNGRPANFPGGTATLRFTTGGDVNHNYFMLVPAKTIVALGITISGANPVISIPTQAGASYTIEYKSNLASATWNYLTMVLGDGTTKTVVDPATMGDQRYYRAIIK